MSWLKMIFFQLIISIQEEGLALFSYQTTLVLVLCQNQSSITCACLESTDEAGRVAHPSPTRRDAGRGVRRGWPHVGAASEFYLFIYFSWICANSAQFALNQDDSARIRPYWPYQVVSAGDWYGRNRPKLASKLAGAVEILTSDVFLAFFFLCFVNQVY